MADFVAPGNKAAKRALLLEQRPYQRILDSVFGWFTGLLCVAATLFAAFNADIEEDAVSLIVFGGLFSSFLAGLFTWLQLNKLLAKRNTRKVADYRSRGQIISISRTTLDIWNEVAEELDIPAHYTKSQPAERFDLLLKLLRFDEMIGKADDERRERLLQRIREEITAELSVVSAKLKLAAAEEDRLDHLSAESNQRYIDDLLGD